MNDIYIFGHRKPDTDAVTSAIALSYLKNQQGLKTKPFILDPINTETEFVLKHFGIKVPKILNDVKLRIEDMKYHQNFYVQYNTSILKSYEQIKEKNVTAIPVVDENKQFLGLVTLKTIAQFLINEQIRNITTSYDNIIESVEGKKILKFDDEISGNIFLGTDKTEEILEGQKLDTKSIFITANRRRIIDYAIKSQIKLIILIGNRELTKEQIEYAKKNRINVIHTKFDSFHVSKVIGLSNYISALLGGSRKATINKKDYIETLQEVSSKDGHNNYPVVDDNGKCEGLIRITGITEKPRKKVILVDHNEMEQSVSGLEEAEILEIVDHHKIGNLTTNKPINFRNMGVGSSNTIIYLMYNEARVEIPQNIAGIMFSGIISDTLNFTSPTTTDIDIEAAKSLAQIAQIDRNEYANMMFREGTKLKGKTIDQIIGSDLKVFQTEDEKLAVSQIFTLSAEEILEKKQEYIDAMEKMKEAKGYSMFVMFITDIMRKGSYLLYCEDSKNRLKNAMNLDEIYQGLFMEGILSRKKQIIPRIMKII